MTTILLVEESRDDREHLGRALAAAGYEVLEARDGRETIAVLQDRKPDLLLIGAVLPYRSGFEICAAIRRHPRWAALPVVLMSSLTRTLGRPDSYWRDRTCADDFISKPCDLPELLARIDAALSFANFAGRD